MASAGTVTLELDANSVKLLREMQKAQRQTRTTSNSMKRSMGDAFQSIRKNANLAAKAVAVSIGAMIAANAALIRSNMQNIDSLSKTAQSVDGTIASLQGLQLAGREAGVDVSAVSSSAQILNQRLGEAARGTGEAVKALDALGLSAKDIQQLDVAERFAVISDRMRELGFNTAQSADVLRSFGIRNREMVVLMQQGGSAIREAANRVDQFGLAISEIDAAKIEQANDQLAFARDIMGRGMQEAAIAVAPILTELANKFIDISNEAGGMGNIAVKSLDAIVKGVGIAGNAFHGWRMIIKGIEAAFHGLVMVVSNSFAAILESLNSTLRFAAKGINTLTNQMNRIPGINLGELVVGESEMARNLRVAGINAQIEFADAMFGLHKIAAQPLPSEQFDEFVRQARIKGEEAAAAIIESRQAIRGGLLQESTDEAEKQINQMSQFATQAARSMQSAFADFLFDPFQDGLKGMLRGFIDTVRRMMAEAAAAQILQSMFGGFAASTNPIAAGLGAAFGGTRDQGGSGQAGKAYVINPKAGPEVFIPSTAGEFIPNIDEKLGGAANISLTIDARDAGAEARIKDMIMREMVPQIITAAKSETINTIRRPRFA